MKVDDTVPCDMYKEEVKERLVKRALGSTKKCANNHNRVFRITIDDYGYIGTMNIVVSDNQIYLLLVTT